MSLLISCELAGNVIPSRFVDAVESAGKSAFESDPCDQWASYVTRRMAKRLRAPLIENRYSNELIDVTRSLHHPRLFSPLTRSWSAEDRRILLDSIYHPYRNKLRAEIKSKLDRFGQLVHLSIRTFESYHQGKPRRADVGLLYDPGVDDEVNLCLDWIDLLFDDAPMLRVRRNYPRRGTTDSVTRSMRSEFSGRGYLGIEVLINRAWAARAVALRDEAIDGICCSLQAVTDASWSDAA